MISHSHLREMRTIIYTRDRKQAREMGLNRFDYARTGIDANGEAHTSESFAFVLSLADAMALLGDWNRQGAATPYFWSYTFKGLRSGCGEDAR